MHLLLAAGAFLLIYVILPIAQGCYNCYQHNHEWTELELMKRAPRSSKHPNTWMVDGPYTLWPSGVCKLKYERINKECWGDDCFETGKRPTYEEYKYKWTVRPDKQSWDEYFSGKYGADYARKYPYLRWPDEYLNPDGTHVYNGYKFKDK